jgi:c-di-AMP phosphodiesterase-like protein
MHELFEKLTENIKNHDEIIIMTHAKPDLDGMASAMALYKVVLFFNKPCFIVEAKEKVDKSLNKAFQMTDKLDINFKREEEIVNDKKQLLVILDTQKEERVESSKLIKEIDDILVVDHHLNSSKKIDKAFYMFCDVDKSSIVEIMVEYIKFLNLEINPLISTMLLAGMEVDTNNFGLKTTSETFEMAAILAKNADLFLVEELLKEPRAEMVERYKFISKSENISKHIVVCKMDDEIHSNVEVALLAKELLKFENTHASFAIGYLDKYVVGVSARSMGKVNVEKVMKRLGGGGHLTDAACQIKNITIDEALKKLKTALKEEGLCE